MKITPILCTDTKAQELMKRCRRGSSDDTDPFLMTQLNIFDLETNSPITQQTILGTLDAFIHNIPIPHYLDYLDPTIIQKQDFSCNYCWQNPKDDFEIRLKGWLTEYKEQVRSPIQKDDFDSFMKELLSYLGNPKFFFHTTTIFITPNYYCPNINAIIVTQNHRKHPVDKLAMFSFFCPD